MTSSPDDIDTAAVGSSILRGLKKVLMATALAGGVTFAVLNLMTPKYASEARLLIDNDVPEAMKPIGTSDRGEAQRPDREAVTSQVEILKSKDVATGVVKALKLNSNPEFNNALGGSDLLGGLLGALGFGPSASESEEQRVLGAYYKRLEVYNVKDSRVVAIRFQSADPALAAKTANALADNFIEWQKSQRLTQDKGAGQVIGAEIPKLRGELSAAEIELERFRAQTGQLKTTGAGSQESATVNSQQLTEINTKLNDARSQRAEAEARAKIVRGVLNTPAQVEASPDVMKSPVIQQLQVQKARIDRQIAELSATLLPAHPRMQQLRAEQQGFARQVRDEAQKVVASLENEAKIAGSREAALKAELDRMVQNTGKASVDVGKLKELEAIVRSKREVLESYEKRYRDAQTRDATSAVPAFARIISRAQESSTPVFPKTGPYTLMAMAATFLGGLGLTLLGSLFTGARSGGSGPVSSRASRASQAAPAQSRPLAAAPAPAAAAAAPAPSNPQPASSLETIAAHLLTRASAQPGYRTLITGDDDAQEVATEAIELARRLAAADKKVVLVDWSVAAKPVSALLPIPRTPGIRELIANEQPFEAVIHKVEDSALQVIPSGKPRTESESPEEIESIHLVFEALDESFDHIIVTAEQTVARHLFGILDGGFDAGLLVGRPGTSAGKGEPGFLGYSVPELEVLRYVPPQAGRTSSRLAAIRGAVGEATTGAPAARN